MSRTSLTVLASVALLAACGTKAPDAGADANAPKMDAAPKVPRVMGFEAGKGVDAMGMIAGGVMTVFAPTDTINISVRTENVGLGAKIQVQMMEDTMHLGSVDVAAPAPDSAGQAMVALKMAPPKPMKVGKYQLRVMIDTTFQMAKEIEITKNGQPTPDKPEAKPAAKAPTKTPVKGGGMTKAPPKAGSGGLN